MIPERVQQMYQLYKDGLTLSEVGEKFDITRQRVEQLLKQHGYKNRSRKEAARNAQEHGRLPKKVWRESMRVVWARQREEMIQLYDSGLSLREVGERYGFQGENPAGVVHMILRKDPRYKARPHDPRPWMYKIHESNRLNRKLGGVMAKMTVMSDQMIEFLKEKGVDVTLMHSALEEWRTIGARGAYYARLDDNALHSAYTKASDQLKAIENELAKRRNGNAS